MNKKRSAQLDTLLAESLNLHRAGRLAEAEVGYRKILAKDERNGGARYLLGTLLHQTGNSAAAVKELERSIRDQPREASMHVNLGGVYLALDRPEDAAAACRQAIRLKPDMAAAYFNLGDALRRLRDWSAATEAYESYLNLQPTDGLGHGALGDTLKERGLFDAAMVAFEMALTYAPDHPGAYLGVADLMYQKGLTSAAVVAMERAAAVAPQDKDVQRRSGEMKLALGHLAEGWDIFDENRFTTTKGGVARRPTPPPYWRGEDLGGKSIIVWNEQGVGDETLYASILPEVIARAGKAILACSARMAPVYARSFQGAEIRPWDGTVLPLKPGEAVDYQVAIGSLGRYLRRDFAHFPAQRGYLKADRDQTALLRRKYEGLANGRRIVGLAWKSKHEILGISKSADLTRLGPILESPNAFFVNLQYGDCRQEIAAAEARFNVQIHQDEDVNPLADMDAFFSQVAALDLVISTSNSAVHVAGALDVPTWLLLPHGRGALWYWFYQREDSPWYPSLKIIRASGNKPDQAWETGPALSAGSMLRTAEIGGSAP